MILLGLYKSAFYNEITPFSFLSTKSGLKPKNHKMLSMLQLTYFTNMDLFWAIIYTKMGSKRAF